MCVLFQVTFVSLILDSRGGSSEVDGRSRYVAPSSTWVRSWFNFLVNKMHFMAECHVCLFQLQRVGWLHHSDIRAPPAFSSRWTRLTQLWMRCTCDAICTFFVSTVLQFVYLCFPLFIFWLMLIFLSRFSVFVGTAPEVLTGGPYNHAADWWSLGIMLFSLVKGEVRTHRLCVYWLCILLLFLIIYLIVLLLIPLIQLNYFHLPVLYWNDGSLQSLWRLLCHFPAVLFNLYSKFYSYIVYWCFVYVV